jgi:prepilin-type N-terminal cleavage/methylation domain-containing protein
MTSTFPSPPALRPPPKTAPAMVRDQAGFTLLEVLVVMLLLSLIVGALMAPMVLSIKDQTRDANYAYAQQNARTGLDSMVSQIRQAWAILSSGPNAVQLNVNLNGVALVVYYECDVPQPGTSYHECVRLQAPAGSALPPLTSASVAITNLTNGTATDPVFSFGPDPVAPYYMTARIRVPASGGTTGGLTHTIVLSTGALMRNLNVGN